MTTFNIGDEVEVVFVGNGHPDDKADLGLIGVITEITDLERSFPYRVKFHEPKRKPSNVFNATELKLSDNLFGQP